MGRWKIVREPCPHCHGSRKIDGHTCPYCGGKGFIAKKDKPPNKVQMSEQDAAATPVNSMGSSSSVHGTGSIDTVDKPLSLIKRKPISRNKPFKTKF